tara:strand:- start:1661 stop:1840 length:180 start_codon:yes stop_codon:yes gene_type:complete
MELLDFQGKKWVVKAKVDGHRVDDPSTLKSNYGADMVIKNSQNFYFILDEVIDVEFEDI